MSKHVWIGGNRYMVTNAFDDAPDSEDMSNLRDLNALIVKSLPTLTPEQIEKQDAARQRNRERVARITGNNADGSKP